MKRKTDSINKAILNPSDFVKYVGPSIIQELQEITSALICFDPDNYKELLTQFQGRDIKGLSGEARLTDFNILLCGNFGIGSPAAVNLIEELIACGLRNIIAFGTAGALNNAIEQGTLILCQEAFSDEGTSAHYFPDAKSGKPSGKLLSEVMEYLNAKNLKFKSGKSWTTDAPYRETMEKLNHFNGLGADVVDMEASALYNVAAFRRVDLLATFIVGDSIADGVWKPYFDSESIKHKLNQVSYTLVNFFQFKEKYLTE